MVLQLLSYHAERNRVLVSRTLSTIFVAFRRDFASFSFSISISAFYFSVYLRIVHLISIAKWAVVQHAGTILSYFSI